MQGTGYDYQFQDHPTASSNLAQGRPATQSSTLYGGVAGRAVDGNTDGHYSDSSTTHTAGHGGNDPQAW